MLKALIAKRARPQAQSLALEALAPPSLPLERRAPSLPILTHHRNGEVLARLEAIDERLRERGLTPAEPKRSRSLSETSRKVFERLKAAFD